MSAVVAGTGCRFGFELSSPDGGGGEDGSRCRPSLVATSTIGSTADVSTLTLPDHDAGADRGRVLLVGAGLPSDSTTWQSIRYDGIPLSPIAAFTSGSRARTELWALVDPPAGLHDVVLTASNARAAAAVAISISGLDSDPIGEERHAGDSSSRSELDISAESSDLAVDLVVQGSDDLGREFDETDIATPGSEQTERARVQDAAPSRNVRVLMSTASGESDPRMSWTFSGGYDHGHVAVPLRACGGGDGSGD